MKFKAPASGIALIGVSLLIAVAALWLHWGPTIFIAGLGGMLC